MIPDRLMNGAIRGLVSCGEEGVHLVVGSVDRAGRPRFLFAFAAQLQRGLDEGLGLGLSYLSIHRKLPPHSAEKGLSQPILSETRAAG